MEAVKPRARSRVGWHERAPRWAIAAILLSTLAEANVRPSDTAAPGAPSPLRSLEALDVAAEVTAFETFRIVAVNTREEVVVEMSGPGGAASEASMREVARLLRCLRTQTEHEIDPALVAMLHRIAREAGGTVELVSGFRAPTHARDHNFHTRGQAADIRVPGMKTLELRALTRRLAAPGVGYYPVSKMIHVDVRDVPFAWTDWSGPHVRR